MENSIYVIKVGSDSVYQKDSPILSEIKDLLDKNKKVILVSGGARSIKDYYYENSIEEKFVTLYKMVTLLDFQTLKTYIISKTLI